MASEALKISKLHGALLLFEFEDSFEAERVLQRGSHRFREKLLVLQKWGPEVDGCSTGGLAKEVWVRAVGLPLNFWSRNMFWKIGDCCGGFVAVDEDTAGFVQ